MNQPILLSNTCIECGKLKDRSKFTTSNNLLRKLPDVCKNCKQKKHVYKYRKNSEKAKEHIRIYALEYYHKNKTLNKNKNKNKNL